MFNLSGSELIFLVVIALVVLGPDKLPEAMRKAGKAYADFKRMTSGFQSEMKSVLDEPLRELRETAELAKNAASWDTNMFNPTSGSDAKSPGGPTDRTVAAAQPAATSAANGSAPPAAATVPVVAAAVGADAAVAAAVVADGPAVEVPEPTDATSRRLARQQAPDISVSTASLPVAAVTPDAVVASGMMTGFGAVPPTEPLETVESVETADEVAAE